MKQLTVLDLFCGAGGFSEGFRQMGFHVTHAVDNWRPAVETHRINQPDTEAILADVSGLNPKDFGRPDVIIGGPPCTEFSGSKRGGGGDFKKGMKLVLEFMRFVHALKPRYWIMENVARLDRIMPHRIRLQDIGFEEPGFFDIPVRQVFNAADFGAPQKRLRLLSGKYPTPVQTHFEKSQLTLNNLRYQPWRTMREIIKAFPNPIGRVNKNKMIRDPNYPIIVQLEKLEDHFMKPEDALMKRGEAERNRRQKMEHAYYGKMKFPDDMDRPSRTVMATQFNASRETMVIQTRHRGEIRFRKPTVRECASLQCYPITYKFPAKNITTKYKLVGNSVPVMLSRAFAKAILQEEGMKVPALPIIEMV